MFSCVLRANHAPGETFDFYIDGATANVFDVNICVVVGRGHSTTFGRIVIAPADEATSPARSFDALKSG